MGSCREMVMEILSGVNLLFWRNVICVKYNSDVGEWYIMVNWLSYGMGLWRSIRNS